MAASEVEIVNSGLTKIREKSISSLTQDKKSARLANRQYPRLRKKLIRTYLWRFAMTRSETLAAEGMGAKFGFENRFLVPTDTLRVIGIYDEQEPQQNYTSSRIPWKLEGRFIVSDEDSLQIFYLRDITDTAQFDPIFEEVLAIDLAIDLAYGLSSGLNRIEQLKDDRRDWIREARNANAIEGFPQTVVASEWLDSRRFDDAPPHRIGPALGFS